MKNKSPNMLSELSLAPRKSISCCVGSVGMHQPVVVIGGVRVDLVGGGGRTGLLQNS